MNRIWTFCKAHKNIIFLGLIVVLALRVFLPQLDSLTQSVEELKQADLSWILLGLVFFSFSTPLVTWQFVEIALAPLKFLLTLRVQIASLFVSKLLPVGLGNIAINMYYFVQEKHTLAQATAVMAANTVTGAIAYVIMIILGFTFSDFNIENGGVNMPDWSLGTIVLIILSVVAILYLVYRIPKVRGKVNNAISDLMDSFKPYKKRPWSIVLATLLNGIGSAMSLLALFTSAHALGIDLSISQALVAYTLGNIASAVVPTPGGIGSAEAGIYAGLTLVGIESSSAIGITLLYRLITYWIPIVPGYIFFRGLKKDVLKNFDLKSSAKTAKEATS